MWTRGLGCFAGGVRLVGPRAVWFLFVRERPCLREVHGRVRDVEGVAFLEKLFCLVCGDDAPDDGWPLSRVFVACAYGEDLLGELGCGYWLCHVFAVWPGVSECGVLGGGSDSGCAAVGFECECGGDVADVLVAEVCVAGCGCFTRSVACVVPVRSCACFCVCGRSCAALLVQVVGVLVP